MNDFSKTENNDEKLSHDNKKLVNEIIQATWQYGSRAAITERHNHVSNMPFSQEILPVPVELRDKDGIKIDRTSGTTETIKYTFMKQLKLKNKSNSLSKFHNKTIISYYDKQKNQEKLLKQQQEASAMLQNNSYQSRNDGIPKMNFGEQNTQNLPFPEGGEEYPAVRIGHDGPEESNQKSDNLTNPGQGIMNTTNLDFIDQSQKQVDNKPVQAAQAAISSQPVFYKSRKYKSPYSAALLPAESSQCQKKDKSELLTDNLPTIELRLDPLEVEEDSIDFGIDSPDACQNPSSQTILSQNSNPGNPHQTVSNVTPSISITAPPTPITPTCKLENESPYIQGKFNSPQTITYNQKAKRNDIGGCHNQSSVEEIYSKRLIAKGLKVNISQNSRKRQHESNKVVDMHLVDKKAKSDDLESLASHNNTIPSTVCTEDSGLKSMEPNNDKDSYDFNDNDSGYKVHSPQDFFLHLKVPDENGSECQDIEQYIINLTSNLNKNTNLDNLTGATYKPLENLPGKNFAKETQMYTYTPRQDMFSAFANHFNNFGQSGQMMGGAAGGPHLQNNCDMQMGNFNVQSEWSNLNNCNQGNSMNSNLMNSSGKGKIMPDHQTLHQQSAKKPVTIKDEALGSIKEPKSVKMPNYLPSPSYLPSPRNASGTGNGPPSVSHGTPKSCQNPASVGPPPSVGAPGGPPSVISRQPKTPGSVNPGSVAPPGSVGGPPRSVSSKLGIGTNLGSVLSQRDQNSPAATTMIKSHRGMLAPKTPATGPVSVMTPGRCGLATPGQPPSTLDPYSYPRDINNINSSIPQRIKRLQQFPEAHSLSFNLYLSDSLLNVFRDHCFDQCPICVCNVEKGFPLTGFDHDMLGRELNKNSHKTLKDVKSMYPRDFNDYSQCNCGFSSLRNRQISFATGMMLEDELEVLTSSQIQHQKKIIALRKDLKINEDGTVEKNEVVEFTALRLLDLSRYYHECSTLFGSSFSWLLGNLKEEVQSTRLNTTVEKRKLFQKTTQVSASKNKPGVGKISAKSIFPNQATGAHTSAYSRENHNSTTSQTLAIKDHDRSNPGKQRNFMAEHDIFLACIKAQVAAHAIIDVNTSLRIAQSSEEGDNSHNWGLVSTIIHPWNYSGSVLPSSSSVKISVQNCSTEVKVVKLLKSLKNLLQDAVQKGGQVHDVPNRTVKGPLTWREFIAVGLSTETDPVAKSIALANSQALPVPRILTKQSNVSQQSLYDSPSINKNPALIYRNSHHNFNMSQEVSPNALSYWEHLGLQPNTQTQDIVYVCIYPETVESLAKNFMNQLSSYYETNKLGRHKPLHLYENANITENDACSKEKPNMKFQNIAFNPVGNINGIDINGDEENPHLESSEKVKLTTELYKYKDTIFNACRRLKKHFVADCSLLTGGMYQSNINGFNELHETLPDDPYIYDEFKDKKAPIIMFYLIEMGYNGYPSNHKACKHNLFGIMHLMQAWSAGMKDILGMKDPNEMNNLSHLCELQIVPLVALSQMSEAKTNLITSTAFCSYNKAAARYAEFNRLFLEITNLAGPNGFTSLLNRTDNNLKKERSIALSNAKTQQQLPQLYQPGYIIADNWYDPRVHISQDPDLLSRLENQNKGLLGNNEKMDLSTNNPNLGRNESPTDMDIGNAQNKLIRMWQTKTLFVCYCISHDQSWLIVTVVDNFGALMDSNCININTEYDLKSCRSKMSARKIGIKKLWNYIISIISATTVEWNITISRLGRLGHGEMKEWLGYLQTPSVRLTINNLKKLATDYLDDITVQPRYLAHATINSVILTSLELETSLSVFPKVASPSTKHPVTNNQFDSSHIVVFPTSAIINKIDKTAMGMSLGKDPNSLDELDDLFPFDEDDNDDDDMITTDLVGVTKPTQGLDSKQENESSSSKAKIKIKKENLEELVEPLPSLRSDTGNSYSNINSCAIVDAKKDYSKKWGEDILMQPLSVGLLISSAPIVYPGCALPSWLWAPEPGQATRSVDATGLTYSTTIGKGKKPVCLRIALHYHGVNISDDSTAEHAKPINDSSLGFGSKFFFLEIYRYYVRYLFISLYSTY